MAFRIVDNCDGTLFHDGEIFKDEGVARFELLQFHIGAATLADDFLPPGIMDFTFEQVLEFGDWEVEEMREEYYAVGTTAYTADGINYFNRSGQHLRNPEEYNRNVEGYTPFGDEGDDYE